MRKTLIWTQILYEKVWIFFDLNCSVVWCFQNAVLFFFLFPWEPACDWHSPCFVPSKNRTMAPLQFLYSVSSLRHLPSSAVKNGTDVACFQFRKWHQAQICKVNDCTQEISPETKIWGLITLYLFREVHLPSLESWNLPLFSLLSCTPWPLCNGVFFLFLWSCKVLRHWRTKTMQTAQVVL